jgi:hypothetical protein
MPKPVLIVARCIVCLVTAWPLIAGLCLRLHPSSAKGGRP